MVKLVVRVTVSHFNCMSQWRSREGGGIPCNKPTRCTIFSNLFLEWKSTCFGQFLCPSSEFFHCTHSTGICHTVLLTAASRILILLPSCQQTCRTYTVAVCTVKTRDCGQRNCPKHVDFHSKNIFEKLVHLVGFIYKEI